MVRLIRQPNHVRISGIDQGASGATPITGPEIAEEMVASRARARVFLAHWHDFLATRDVERLKPHLAPEVEFRAARHHRFQCAQQPALWLLASLIEDMESLAHPRQWMAGDQLVLECHVRMNGAALYGYAVVSLDDTGRLTGLEVVLDGMSLKLGPPPGRAAIVH